MTTSSPSQESEALDQQDRINPVVFYGSGLAILLFALWAMFFTEAAGTVQQGFDIRDRVGRRHPRER